MSPRYVQGEADWYQLERELASKLAWSMGTVFGWEYNRSTGVYAGCLTAAAEIVAQLRPFH